MIVNRNIFIFFCVVGSIESACQVRAIGFKSESYHFENLFEQFKPTVDFCFPDIEICRGVKVNNSPKAIGYAVDQAVEYFEWKRAHGFVFSASLANPIRMEKEKARLSTIIYAVNVEKFLIVLHTDKQWLAKDFSINTQGYQIPFHSYLATWDKGGIDQSNDDLVEGNAISVFYLPQDVDKPSEFIIGGMAVETFSSHESSGVLSWVDSVAGIYHSDGKIFDEYSRWSSIKLSQGDIPSFEDFGVRKGFFSGVIEFKGTRFPYDEARILADLIRQIAHRYPFYDERGLDKKLIIGRLESVFKENSHDLSKLCNALKNAIEHEYDDPHFGVFLPKNNSVKEEKIAKLPITVRNIAGVPVVAAVYSESIKNTVSVGSRIISINGSSLAAFNGNYDVLLRQCKDTLQMIVEPDNGNLQNIKIPTNVKISIDSRFSSTHGEVKMLHDSLFYIKFNNWSGDNYYRILNNRDLIMHSKGVIIDLRGNGGGYGSDAYATLSLFINDVLPLGTIDYPWFKESIVIYPDRKEFCMPADLKVAILMDGSTACASEIFMMGMRARQKSIIIGDSNSRGAIASPTLYTFPSGLIVKAHTNIRMYNFKSEGYREGTGIAPDVIVARTHARDLKPYEDKVLKVASALLKK